jgi:hypothetical protein
MALILKDRVKETTAVTSTGTATLLGASIGYQSFSVIGNGNTCYYTIAAQTTNEWEVGIGTYTSPNQLSRDTVLSSSNSNALVNFSAGTKDVFVAQPAGKAVYTDASNTINTSGNGANTVAFTNINASNVVMVSGTISTNAANATDITNKTYVDGLFSTGITYHDPVLVESPTALIATYNQPGGAGNGVGATLTNSGANVALSIDGVSLSNTARVLVYTQSNAVHNGVYTVTNAGAPDVPGPGAAWVLTRATDADTYGVGDPNKLGQGDAFFVQSGNTGAGETYILNTVGTITFGTTNLTFAQISSAQVYSAGTGLNLANLTFSIANTAVTAATYGNAGQVPQIAVNAQGQITSASNVSINASSITLGTLDNARTTAASANGASTIVARDANGNFTANVITATTSNATTFNGTTGSFTNVSGNGVALTAINASNITSGTIANARTTASDANSASTIVARDANGSFGANIITATFSGNGATLSAINASNISSGTIANARTTASSSNGASTIVQRDSGGNFSANTVTAAVIGDLSGGSNINASNIASGTIANARTTASSSNGASTIVLRGASGEFAAGAITGASFSGNGSAITAINATAITTGTIDNARTTASSANGASTIVARDAGGNFSANTITATTFSGAMSGNGAALTNINASNISSGTIANARTTAATANGASTIVLRGTSGEFSAGAITGASFTGDGAAISAINASNVSTGTIANARTTGSAANGASTLVLRDANGSFAGNVITGTTGTFTSVSGNGVALTAINASNIASGTIANARTTASDANGASTIVSRSAAGSFAGNVGTFNGVTVGTTNSSFDTDVLFVDATNNRVGVGTTSPGTTLNLRFAAGAGGPQIRFDQVSDNPYMEFDRWTGTASNYNAGRIYVDGSSNGLVFASATTDAAIGAHTFSERMRIITNGNVGIGTASPAKKLTISDTDQSTARIRIINTLGRTYDLVSGVDGLLQSGFSIFDATAAATRMTIDSTGNVGIGTTSPVGRVSVTTSGNATSSGAPTAWDSTYAVIGTGAGSTTGTALGFGTTATTGYILSLSPNLFWRDLVYSAATHIFRAPDTERMRILSDGNVAIGSATAGTYVPLSSGKKLYIVGDVLSEWGDNRFFGMPFQDGAAYKIGMELNASTRDLNLICESPNDGGGTRSIRFLTGATPDERMRITPAGLVGIGTASPASALDVNGIIRAQGATISASGAGVEVVYTNSTTWFGATNQGIVQAYNRAGSAYTPLAVGGLQLAFVTGTGGTERMRIDDSGNVGIGTSSPSTPLASVRGMVINGAALTDVQFRLQNNNTGSTSGDGVLLSLASDSSAYLWNYENQAFIFGTNNTERMRVTNAGNLLIATTTAVSTLTVNGDIDANFFINSNTISANYTVPANFNAMTAGPITINTGITVTVSTGSVWTVI